MIKLKTIRLKSKEERRFKMGHPWVFSNELQESPKNLALGELVQVCDAGGAFIAYGMANPHSLIAFRELSRDESSKHFQEGEVSVTFFEEKIKAALEYRKNWFSLNQSFRLVYGEADGLSGLIIDRFSGKKHTVYVIQPHSAGMDLRLEKITQALTHLFKGVDQNPLAILRRDAGSREREGLAKEEPKVMSLSGDTPVDEALFQEFEFQVGGIMGETLTFSADLIGGQKTGFFFDQLQNIRLLEGVLLRQQAQKKKNQVRMLDLCSYVGQWGSHVTHVMSRKELQSLEVTCVDASERALQLASLNISRTSQASQIKAQVSGVKADVLKPMPFLEQASYDIVVADPPAFIKNRKSIPQGKQAYASLFQTAIEKTAKGGIVVCCSCSQLLSQEDFLECLGKASRRSRRNVRWLLQGSPSFDHPTKLEFQEGHYLKCYIGQVD